VGGRHTTLVDPINVDALPWHFVLKLLAHYFEQEFWRGTARNGYMQLLPYIGFCKCLLQYTLGHCACSFGGIVMFVQLVIHDFSFVLLFMNKDTVWKKLFKNSAVGTSKRKYSPLTP
jgi:hypothetical protein